MFNFYKRNKNINNTSSELDTWIVRWNQRYGEFLGDYKETARFFNNKEDAEAFKDELRKAMNVLGHSSSHLNWIKFEKIDKNKV